MFLLLTFKEEKSALFFCLKKHQLTSFYTHTHPTQTYFYIEICTVSQIDHQRISQYYSSTSTTFSGTCKFTFGKRPVLSIGIVQPLQYPWGTDWARGKREISQSYLQHCVGTVRGPGRVVYLLENKLHRLESDLCQYWQCGFTAYSLWRRHRYLNFSAFEMTAIIKININNTVIGNPNFWPIFAIA